ncbi:MAG: hypothetical protein IKY02_03205 [Lachnospiraceae bacterium]|nr:hypothetical protein [Lachnospiraceae bacterium]
MAVGLLSGCQETKPTEATSKPTTSPTTKPTEKGTEAPTEEPIIPATFKQAEYNTTTSVMPSNWNEFTYQDNNDRQILANITSSFFEYDYKFEDDEKYLPDGSINVDGLVEGAYTVNYSAATKLEDVTATVDAKWGYTDAQKAEGGYAWKITLRDDLKWDDGTPITAADFEYSMKQILDPAFMNYRANTYYDTLMIKNSKVYFFQNQEGTYEMVGNLGYSSIQEALDAGVTVWANIWDFWGAEGYKDAEGNEAPQWVSLTDETVYDKEGGGDPISGAIVFKDYGAYVEVGASYAAYVGIFVENTVRNVPWEDVGLYAIKSENAIVVCMDKAYSFLKEDGSLSVWAPYYFSSLPLAHQAKYEASKTAPAEGATLWTSNYNSSLETTASWGPYKLAEFEAGSHYKLVKNEAWYGWNMELYKNQYNISAINCRKVEEFTTRWMGFLNGTYDDGELQTENYVDYQDSKYVYYTSTSTGTYGMQLYSNLNVLKNSENNNGILAVLEFRQAFNLALNRSDIVEKIWPGSVVPCFGLLSPGYYYDIENSPELEDGGVYRNTTIAKEGILRAYGFVQGTDGKWTNLDLTGLTTDDAYELLTGYNPTLAKQKFKEAIEILNANAEYYGYDNTKNITIIYGSSVDNAKQRFRVEYLQTVLDDLSKGTELEDKIDLVFDASAGSKWSDAFRAGNTQLGFGYGFTGNAFNPFDIVGAFVNPAEDLNYHQYWDTSAIDLTLTMPAGDYDGAGKTITMSVQNWFFCLNGLAETEKQKETYNWGAGFAPAEARLMILSALEEITIKESRSVMLISDGGGSFLGAKFTYFSPNENTFMGFGGMRYMIVNYTDEEWAEFVKANNNDLSAEYRKSE